MSAQLALVAALATSSQAPSGVALVRARLVALSEDGTWWVRLACGRRLACDVLACGDDVPWSLDQEVLVHVPAQEDGRGVVVGRIDRYTPPQPRSHLALEATESLSLQCGASSLELRADGKVLLKGDDVVIRAKGTQRIRAGNVAIN